MRVLVTGSTDGIGLATARQLAAAGHAVVVHGRKENRVAAAVDQVRRDADGTRHDGEPSVSVEGIVGDLASLALTDELAAGVMERFPDLLVLVNNAGVMRRAREESVDGYELTLAVNHLAHMLLTLRLLPTLRANAKVSRSPARIVNVASMVHEYNSVNWNDLQFRGSYDGQAAYGQSKVANVMFTRALAARLDGASDETAPAVTVNALHPGVIDTKLLHVFYGGGATPKSGARTSVYLATDANVARTTGRYFSNERESPSWVLADAPDESERLWDTSVQLIEAVVGRPLLSGF